MNSLSYTMTLLAFFGVAALMLMVNLEQSQGIGR